MWIYVRNSGQGNAGLTNSIKLYNVQIQIFDTDGLLFSQIYSKPHTF